MKLRGVLFDFDGTLFHIENVHQQIIREVFEEHTGKKLSDEENRTTVGLVYYDRFARLLGAHGIDDDEVVSALEKKARTLMHGRLDIKQTLVPGGPELIRDLHAGGVRLAVVSSALRDRIDAGLREVGLRDFFEVITGREEVSERKPDPEPYILTLQKLGLAPGEAVVFEDSPAGIASAKSAGIKTVAVLTTFSHEDVTAADSAIKNFTETSHALLQKLIE